MRSNYHSFYTIENQIKILFF